MSRTEAPRKVRFLKPPNILKQKVGDGGVPPERIARAQDFIEGTRVDFKPFAEEYLKTIEAALRGWEARNLSAREAIDRMTLPIMQMKANGGMFRYALISEIADTLLYFLEKLETLNADGVAVIRVHLSALASITTNSLTGSGGREARALIKELDLACDRYVKKHGVE